MIRNLKTTVIYDSQRSNFSNSKDKKEKLDPRENTDISIPSQSTFTSNKIE